MTRGGWGEIDAKAETVSPWVSSPARTATIVTPAGKWRRTLRNSSEEIDMSAFSGVVSGSSASRMPASEPSSMAIAVSPDSQPRSASPTSSRRQPVRTGKPGSAARSPSSHQRTSRSTSSRVATKRVAIPASLARAVTSPDSSTDHPFALSGSDGSRVAVRRPGRTGPPGPPPGSPGRGGGPVPSLTPRIAARARSSRRRAPGDLDHRAVLEDPRRRLVVVQGGPLAPGGDAPGARPRSLPRRRFHPLTRRYISSGGHAVGRGLRQALGLLLDPGQASLAPPGAARSIGQAVTR